MVDVELRRSGGSRGVDAREIPTIATLTGCLVLLVTPAPLQALGLLTLVGAVAAWTVSDRLARRLSEEDVRGRS